MSFQIVSNTGAKHFYGAGASIFSILSEYLTGHENIGGSDLVSFTTFILEQLDKLLNERVSPLINERSTRIKEIKYRNKKILIDVSNSLDNEVYSWYNLLELTEKADSLKVTKTSVPI
ncbi:hypothetical protein [Reichenbachiella sp.]|uniref:hypothetical protein n=1 Tax=Reichenbachiella sp. TaxID=2184521 RepID=UPI003299E466